MFAKFSFAPFRSVPLRFAPLNPPDQVRLAKVHSIRSMFPRHSFQALAPCLSNESGIHLPYVSAFRSDPPSFSDSYLEV